MTALTIVALVGGMACLVAGAEVLVRGAAAIATRLGVAPVIIGLTVVAFGTSAPELAVSVGASLGGEADVALGNVVGSNIGNILLILGASAVVGGLVVDQRIVRLDIPLLLGASVLTLVLSLDNSVGRLDGAVLFAGIVAYTVWLARAARQERSEVLQEYDEAIEHLEGAVVERPLLVQVAYVVVGLAVLIVGSQLLVGSATDIAEELGVSDLVIGLTVVAIGTSLPELATSMLAAVRGERDIAVGNVVGSNLFNLLSVLGATGLVAPGGVPVTSGSLQVDFPVMLAATVVLLPIMWRGFRIERWEGVLLVGFYALYVGFLVLDAGEHTVAGLVGTAMVIVVPLVILGFSVTAVQAWRRQRESPG